MVSAAAVRVVVKPVAVRAEAVRVVAVRAAALRVAVGAVKTAAMVESAGTVDASRRGSAALATAPFATDPLATAALAARFSHRIPRPHLRLRRARASPPAPTPPSPRPLPPPSPLSSVMRSFKQISGSIHEGSLQGSGHGEANDGGLYLACCCACARSASRVSASSALSSGRTSKTQSSFGKSSSPESLKMEKSLRSSWVRRWRPRSRAQPQDTGGFEGNFGARTHTPLRTLRSTRGF